MKKPPAALAFDLGASSGRAFIGELVTGEDGLKQLRITEIHRFVNEPVEIGAHLHWDILMLLKELKAGILKAHQQGFEPASFGIDTWGVDFGLLDRSGELLANPYHYRDPHTTGLIEEVCAMIGEDKLFRESGLQLMPFNTIYQLYAMKKAGSVPLEHAQTLLLTPDLLTYFLTGVKACEFTMATTTQLFRPDERVWNEPLMDRLGIPSGLFLAPVHPGTETGRLTAAVCEELGVPSMRAIAVGSHDTESAAAAVPSGSSSFAYLICGTWSLLGTELPDALLTPEVRELEFSNEGGVGNTFQLLKNIMGLWILQECRRKWNKSGAEISFAELTHEAGHAEAFRSLIHPDDLRFMNPKDMEQEIARFCEETNQPVPRSRGETARCILESLALRYHIVLEQCQRLTGRHFSELHMVGGGIQNELLCQLTASAIGRPVWAGPVEASAIGNMLVQFQAGGEIAGIEEGKQLVKRSFPIQTYEPADADKWQEAIARFNRLA
ncbi:rhamnulokinase [Paenibacillus nasutitermitis]|uniref:Rhamnulokinase n=1 Tax=Paenibacillus nasutitermitis TaxID=1652958 RepID=A0A916ZIB2_9BACL|nr:rhamnulokinase family protein [Paenibacillus nasutitermitis]GGD97876.1 rhamnulokinase [Paenibacillus nasutitermitis]